MQRRVQSGLDVLVARGFIPLKGARIGILANQAAVDRKLRHLVDLVAGESGMTLVRLFAPEHGFRGALQDMEQVRSGIDPVTRLEVVTLYGDTPESLRPELAMFEDLDVLVVDLPDIGSRYYTFATTLGYAMGVAGSVDVTVIVLDRPNPVNGITVEGAPLQSSCRSFCGYAPVANRHGLTLGELARLMERGFGEGEDALPPHPCELEVIPLKGWKRECYFDETSLPWVLPSPNIPNLESALTYPGTCLFEATNISEGRGTTKPFELLGAPFINGADWASAVVHEGFALSGAILRPITFIPKYQKWRDRECGGVQIHITDRESFQPFRWGLALISAARRLYPDEFRWRGDAYEFIRDIPAIDLLYGSPRYREVVDAGRSLAELEPELVTFEDWYQEARRDFLLY